ncbi:MAG: hypothetical protein M1564_04100 [Candidatus Marsarchaeota archaeon]|nr:hypothetical protein [Candidatus Marsarchaeota archaeon]
MVLSYTKDYTNSLTESVERSVEHLISGVKENGFMSASRRYPWYYPHWFRDSSFVSMALLRYSSVSRRTQMFSKGEEAFEAADRINGFNSRNILVRIGAIGESNHKLSSDPDFYNLRFHIPARLDENGMLCDKRFTSNGRDFPVVDTNETTYGDSWLRQFDSIPLTILALKQEYQMFGKLPRSANLLLNRYSNELVKYLSKIYDLKSSNAWEMDLDKRHSYDYACIYSGLKALEYFASQGIANIKPEDVMKTFYQYHDKDPIQILKDTFVVDNVLMRYAHGHEQRASAAAGVDSSELFIFSRFLEGELGPEIERRTIEEIISRRFGNNELPTRYPGDIYFTGGRWLLLGLECASYLARNGNSAAAERKIAHVLEHHFDSMPEQVLVEPESPNHEAGLRDLERNNGETIKELEWSYAEYIEAVLSLIAPGIWSTSIIRLQKE